MLLATFILLLVIITESILWLGYAYITALAYDLYCKVSTNEAVVRQRKLRKQVLQLRTEMSQTSSQDEFAKWAKIRRKFDSTTEKLEKTNQDIASSRTQFEVKVKGVLYFVVHGVQVIMVMWFRKSPVFFLPHGWFGPAGRLLSMPFAPKGSVSVVVWFSACRRVCKTVGSLTNDFVKARLMEPPSTTEEKKAQ
ncbi:GET complex subunit get1 [Umbelopsis sp. WA50703]